ncbi:MAG TPA: hypothetical protein VHA30_02780 [Patescibacteria group bacterium]|nr:hypothetical protein [Patescibacteria group bacterium]
MNKELNWETEIRQKYEGLRLQARSQSKAELAERIKTNPIPTADESDLGLFIERLEPQVRASVLTLHQKGYSTISSGFVPENPQEQTISFYKEVQLAPKDKETIEKLGAQVTIKPFRGIEGYYWEISFQAIEPNLNTIKSQWDKISSLMPDTGHKPWRSRLADEFEQKFPPKAP